MAAVTPHVNHHLFWPQHPKSWPVRIPKALQSGNVCWWQENETSCDLAGEQVLLDEEPSAHLRPIHLLKLAFFFWDDISQAPHGLQYVEDVDHAGQEHHVLGYHKPLKIAQDEAEYECDGREQMAPLLEEENGQFILMIIEVTSLLKWYVFILAIINLVINMPWNHKESNVHDQVSIQRF